MTRTCTWFLLLCLTLFLFVGHPISSDPKKDKTKSDPHASLLFTVGTLAAQGLYLTYVSMGTLTDGFSAQAYDKETAQQIMESYVSLSKVCQNQLSNLLQETKLTPEDKKVLREIEITYSYLINHGQAFLDYLSSNDASYLATFDENRKMAWSRIARILQIPE